MVLTLPIHTLSLPTPWPAVGPVHVYLVLQDPVTLIDTGLATPESRAALLAGLREAGVSLKEIRRVLITHAHLDHAGQAAWIQAETGAELWLHPDEAGKADMPDWWREGRKRALVEAGMPADVQQTVESVWEKSRKLAILPVGNWRPMAPGQRFAFASGGALQAVHLPGHALGHTGFFEEASGTLIGGDHLLEGVTPNPIMEPLPPGHEAGVPHAPWRAFTLGQFLGALERVAAMAVRRVLPGHGAVIDDHRAVAHRYLEKHERRLDKLADRLAAGETTVYELTRQVYPWVKEWDIFLAMSEVLAHLDMLVVRGRAACEDHEGRLVYRKM